MMQAFRSQADLMTVVFMKACLPEAAPPRLDGYHAPAPFFDRLSDDLGGIEIGERAKRPGIRRDDGKLSDVMVFHYFFEDDKNCHVHYKY